MPTLLYLAAALTITIGIAHSYLGERFILIPLFRRQDLPKVLGSSDFTIRTLRFAWHVTTIAWWGFATLLIGLAHPPLTSQFVGLVIAATFFIHFVIAILGSRGRHLSWIVFLLIAVFAFLATRA